MDTMYGPRKSAKTALSGEINYYGRKRLCIKKLAHNTYYWRHPVDGTERIRLHKTDILVKHPDGRVELDDGEFMTITTKARMNRFASLFGFNIRISAANGVWHVHYNGCTLPYYTGFTMPNDLGNPNPDAHRDQISERKENLAMAKKVVSVRNEVTDIILRDAVLWAGYGEFIQDNPVATLGVKQATRVVKRYLNRTSGLVA